LPASELRELKRLIKQTAQRYATQDLSDSIEGLIYDFEQIAVRYSFKEMCDTLRALRIAPGQKFFPRPDEVTEAIERARERAATIAAEKRAKSQIDEWEQSFWQWVDDRMSEPANAGKSEQEFLDSVKTPGYTGRKARPEALQAWRKCST